MPIPQLTMSDADLLVVFLSPQGVSFVNQTDDPWYRGFVPRGTFNFPGDDGGQRPLYISDEAASPMGCVSRFQYCNSSKKCSNLASYTDTVTSALTLFHQTPREYWSGNWNEPDATASRFDMFEVIMTSFPSLSEFINTLGPSSLLSSQHLNQGVMGPLPDNQWQLDVIHWFEMLMASKQAAFVSNAHGTTDETVLPYLETTDNEDQLTMCDNQVSNICVTTSCRHPEGCIKEVTY